MKLKEEVRTECSRECAHPQVQVGEKNKWKKIIDLIIYCFLFRISISSSRT